MLNDWAYNLFGVLGYWGNDVDIANNHELVSFQRIVSKAIAKNTEL
jgi:hypothetical protein